MRQFLSDRNELMARIKIKPRECSRTSCWSRAFLASSLHSPNGNTGKGLLGDRCHVGLDSDENYGPLQRVALDSLDPKDFVVGLRDLRERGREGAHL